MLNICDIMGCDGVSLDQTTQLYTPPVRCLRFLVLQIFFAGFEFEKSAGYS